MYEITFTNAGYNVVEPENLRFSWSIWQHAFLYFQGAVILNGKRENAGACILYTQNTPHNYITQKGFMNSFIGFNVSEELFGALGIKTNRVIYPDNCGEINEILKSICREDSERHLGYKHEQAALIMRLLVAIGRGTQPKSEQTENSDLLNRLSEIRFEYLRDVANPPDIEDLIFRSKLSRTQFFKLYTRIFHTSPHRDLMLTRLEKVRGTIAAAPDSKIGSVAAACGFGDIPHFFRLFKSRYGYTPKDYALSVKSTMEK